MIANVNVLRASLYDPGCNMTKCALIVATDRERRCVFAVYISVELGQTFPCTGAFGASDGFGLES